MHMPGANKPQRLQRDRHGYGPCRQGRRCKRQIADLFGRDAAGGQICDAAIGEFEPDVGDIDFRRKNGDAGRADIGQFAAREGEDDVEIVDHQVEHHVHIQAAQREDAHTMDFEEQRQRDDALLFREQIMAPIDQGAEGLLVRKTITAPAAEQSKPIIEPGGDFIDVEELNAGRRQFDGERNPVKAAANFGHGRGIGIGYGEIGAHRDRAGHEKFHRLVLRKALDKVRPSKVIGMRFQNLERRNREKRFATDPQRVSAGGHDHESRARSQEFGDKIRNSRHQVLAIVEHQQDVLAAQKTQQSRAQRPVGFFPGAHRRGDGFHDAPGLCDQSQLDEPHAVPILVNQLRAAFKG